MFFQIDTSNGLAIYEQIVRQIKFAVADGSLHSGDLLPSVRELAKDLAINPNTVSRAYRELQTDQVVRTVRGMGVAIASGASRRCRSDRIKLIQQRLGQVISESLQSGLSREEIQTMIQHELQRVVES